MRLFVLILCLGSCFSTIAQSILINEWMAKNESIVVDEEGDFADWVELYNAGTETVDLAGYFLTDKVYYPQKWQFPSANSLIAPGGFLLIWLDSDQGINELHANFSLSSNGEAIALYRPTGHLVDSVSFGPQPVNISRGRQPDGSPAFRYFSEPTPGGSNTTTGFLGRLEKPIASVAGGLYQTDTVRVSLSHPIPNATIYYSLNGDAPNMLDSIYTNEIIIDTSTVIRAIAVVPDYLNSEVTTENYLLNINHSFPIICLATDRKNIFGADEGIYINYAQDIEQPVHISLYETDGNLEFATDAGIKIHGSGTITQIQKSMAVTLRDEYGADFLDYQLFPELPYSDYNSLILRCSGQDFFYTMFRDALISGLVREIDDVKKLIKDPKLHLQGYRPSIVYLNGEYFGIHNIRERLNSRYVALHSGDDGDNIDMLFRRNKIVEGNLEAYEGFEDFLETGNFATDQILDSIEYWIDYKHYVDYYLLNIFIDNSDWPGNNNRHWRERTPGAQWNYLTYDLDYGLGLAPSEGAYNSGTNSGNTLAISLDSDSEVSPNPQYSTLAMRRFLENDKIRHYFINRMADQLNTFFVTDRILNRITEFKATYAPEYQAHRDLWHMGFENWDYNVNIMRIFVLGRREIVQQHFVDYFEEINGVEELELSVDPPLSGDINFSTMTLTADSLPWRGDYFTGIPIPVEARARRGYFFDSWSDPALGGQASGLFTPNGTANLTANFRLGSTATHPIVINEINYHPGDQNDSGEWVELYNPNDIPVDISGWYLADESNGFFNFPEGSLLGAKAFIILTQDDILFQSLYPDIPSMGNFGDGPEGFKLNNAGETIQLFNAAQTLIDSVTYNDELPWPLAADGDGPTLQLIRADLDNAVPSHWIATQPTPGAVNCPVTALENSLLIDTILITNTNCDTNTLGSIALLPKVADLNYLWNTGHLENASDTLHAGSYFIHLLGSDFCETTSEQVVLSTPIEVTPNITNPSNGNANGNIEISVIGGTMPIQVAWNNDSLGTNLSMLLPGEYIYTLTDGGGCILRDTIVLENVLGVAPYLLHSSFEIIPNPASQKVILKVQWTLPTAASVHLIDSYGQIVYENNFIRHEILTWPIDIKDLPNGIYLVQIITENTISSKALLIAH